jgi:hypothetical protein
VRIHTSVFPVRSPKLNGATCLEITVVFGIGSSSKLAINNPYTGTLARKVILRRYNIIPVKVLGQYYVGKSDERKYIACHASLLQQMVSKVR